MHTNEHIHTYSDQLAILLRAAMADGKKLLKWVLFQFKGIVRHFGEHIFLLSC